ncbi:MAG: hypothetical protein AABY22_23130 [Nanoarchaeota archaeon]
MKQTKNEQDRKGMKNVLELIVRELEARVRNLQMNPNIENKRLFDADMHAYQSMRTMAIEIGVEIQEYDNKIDQLLKK